MLIEKKSKKLKIGIIGCGLVAFVKHMPSLVKLENVEIVSFCFVVTQILDAIYDSAETGRPVYF